MHHLVFIINFFLHLAYGLGVMTHDDVDGLFSSAIALHATALGVPGCWVTPWQRLPFCCPCTAARERSPGLGLRFPSRQQRPPTCALHYGCGKHIIC